MKPHEVIDEIVHDARGSLGTVRFALTAIQDNPSNESMREELLAAADTETTRLVAELSALPVLVEALTGTVNRDAVVAALTRLEENGVDMHGALARHLAAVVDQ